MADIIASVLDQRSVLDSLYKRSNKGVQLDKISFLTWSDEGRPIVDTTLAVTDDDAISSWDNVCDAVKINAANARRFSDKKKNPLGLFSPSDSIFIQGNPCPPVKETTKRLSDEQLIPLVYNYQGYSFSSEFNLVYRGTFSHVTALEDLTAVIRKALQSADPAMGDDVCDQYATYIVAHTAWDTSMMIDLFKRCITVRFPFIEKFQVNAEQVGMNTRVYIGKSSVGHISFTVRCECFVQISDATIKKNEEVTPIPLIFYHDHDIESPEYIKDFLQRLRFVHNEPDALRANAAVPKFNEFFHKSGVRFYFKTTLPATSTAVQAPPTAADVDSDLSDEDDGTTDGSRRRSSVEDKVKFDAIELDALAPTPVSCTSSFSSELYGWGYDSFYSLGVGNASRSQAEGKAVRDEAEARRGTGKTSTVAPVSSLMDEVYEPRPIPISRNIALEQVKMIACSSRHSVLLTHHGCLYSCGDNAEGALGLGDMFPRNVFTLVDWSVQHKASYVTCAAGVVGAHTMAIDTQGLLYGWGFTKAIGRGTVQPTLTPHAIPVPSHADTEFEDELMDDIVSQRAQQQQGQRRAPTEVERRRDDGLSSEEKRRRRMVRTVACGAGFTVCVMMSGEVYAFGQWAHGRLGLGEIPMINVRTRGLRSTPKLARYQLRPVRLLGIENAISVACGEAHVLCLLASGHVLAWGQNALGQLGIGPMRTGLLKDQFSPVLVPPFGSSLRDPHCTTYNRHLIRRFVLSGAGPRYQRRLQYLYQRPDAAHFHAVKGQQVICGAYHSIVMDRDAHCWTWGARGSPCLGHADSKILGEWATRVSNVFSVATNDTEVMVPYELLPWCNLWSTPRRVRAFDTYYTTTRSALGSSEKDSASKSFYYDDYAMVDQQYQQSASMTSAGIAMETDAPPMEAATGVTTEEIVSLDDDITVISQAAIAEATKAQQGTRRQQQQRLKIIQVVAGDLHTMFITNHGRMYLCGSGPAVPSLYPSALDADDEPTGGSSETTNDATKTATTSRGGGERAVVVHSPRCPSAQWLPTVCMRAVRYVASGGSRIFALFDEETVSLNLTSQLYASLRTPSMTSSSSSGVGNGGDDSEDELSKAGLASILSGGSGLLSEYSQALLLKGRADCMVIASGYSFLCHRALLAKRSTELRDMILMETPTVSDPHGTAPDVLTQILLPELHKDAARVLCYFLYRDSLPRYALGNRVLLHALSRCGQRLKLPRLHLLSERYLALLDLPHAMNGRGGGDDDDDVEGGGSGAILDELPPPTLSRDLGNLLGDVDFADVRFVAEGRTVAAHRFVLEARCAYFRAMFQSDFAETASMSKSHHSYGSHHSIAQQRMVEVVLPDSFVGLLRLLIFLYTDTLPDGGDGALLEDLMAADRYGLLEMKSLCENMLIPNRHNWLDLLRAADLLQAHTLKRNVVSFLRDNFHALHLDARHWQDEDERQQEEAARAEAEADDFDDEGRPIYRTKTKDTASSSSNLPSAASVIQELQEEFPQLLESLLFSRTVTFPLPPNQMLITRSVSSKQARVEAEQTPFPYWALLFGAVCMYFYSQVASFVSLGPLIPSVNIGITAIAGVYGAYRLYTELYRRKRI